MYLGSVLHRDQAVGLEVDAELGARGLAVGEQALLEFRIRPSVGDDARAAVGKLLVELLHAVADLPGSNHAFFFKEFLHRPAEELVLRR